MSLYYEPAASEAARGETVVPDPAAAACSDAWVCPSPGRRAGWPGVAGAGSDLEIAGFVIAQIL